MYSLVRPLDVLSRRILSQSVFCQGEEIYICVLDHSRLHTSALSHVFHCLKSVYGSANLRRLRSGRQQCLQVLVSTGSQLSASFIQHSASVNFASKLVLNGAKLTGIARE